MRVGFTLQRYQNQGWVLEFTRVSLFLVILLVSIVSSFFQKGFINFDLLGPFYMIVSVALAVHVLWVTKWEKVIQSPRVLFFGFLLDSLLISLLIYFSGVNQSLFLFLHLVNILLAGMACQSFGALAVAFFTSISFTVAAIFSPEMKALNFLFLLALNNIAFFSVAGLSGYLSEQLQSVGRELTKTGLSLKSAQELNKLVVENIPTGMVSFSEDGQILQANKAAEEITEIVELVGQNWKSLFPHVSIQDGQIFRGDIKYQSIHKNDAKILGLTLSTIFSPEFNQKISIALMDDLTRVRQLEYAARQNEKLAAVGGLAAGIAHEIRNPLAGISGSIEMMSQTVSNEDDRKLMKIVLREIDRLNNLITEFLDYARPETPPTDPVNLSAVLTEALDNIKTNTKLRSDVLQIREYASDLWILGRRDKLTQVFLNIVINSYQAMNDSLNPRMEVQGQISGNFIEVRLKDTGSGMSEATRKRMFEPFHTTKPKGTGLGLAVTHKILEGHGAQIQVESEIGKGTEFVLRFPIAKQNA